MSQNTDSARTNNLDLMIAQAMKSKSKKQYRVAGISVCVDLEAFNEANSDGKEDSENMVWSQAIASLSSKTILDTTQRMNSNEVSYWGFRTSEFIVYDVINQEVVFVAVDARTL